MNALRTLCTLPADVKLSEAPIPKPLEKNQNLQDQHEQSSPRDVRHSVGQEQRLCSFASCPAHDRTGSQTVGGKAGKTGKTANAP